MYPTTTFQFRAGALVGTATGADASTVLTPWVYIWIDLEEKRAVYIGEYGSAASYTLEQRLRYSIKEQPHPTLTQLANNSATTGYDTKRNMAVYAFRLSENGQNRRFRKSVEAWLHWLITHKHAKHHNQYCGFSYTVPAAEAKSVADEIYVQLANLLLW